MRYQMDELYGRLSGANWPSYNWARKQALDALLEKREILNRYKPVLKPFRAD